MMGRRKRDGSRVPHCFHNPLSAPVQFDFIVKNRQCKAILTTGQQFLQNTKAPQHGGAFGHVVQLLIRGAVQSTRSSKWVCHFSAGTEPSYPCHSRRIRRHAFRARRGSASCGCRGNPCSGRVRFGSLFLRKILVLRS